MGLNWLYKMQKSSFGKCNVHTFKCASFPNLLYLYSEYALVNMLVSFYTIGVHALVLEMDHYLVFMHCKNSSHPLTQCIYYML